MSALMAVTHTTPQVRARTKTVTRRVGWKTLTPGTYPVPVQVFREDRTGWPHLVDVRMPEAGER